MSGTPTGTACPNCGHSDRMHRKLDGCVTTIKPDNRIMQGRWCPCPYKPDAIRAATPPSGTPNG